MDKAKALAALREEWGDCQRCGLCKTRKRLVFGEGNPNADILVVGEAPGATEDQKGKPFQGEAGQILDKFLEAANLDRQHDLYITNVICCRPIMDTVDEKTGQPRIDNRPPSKDERLACRDRLMRQIYIVDPHIIVAVGKVSLLALTGIGTVITKMRGDIQTMHFKGVQTEIRYPVLPMFHTAYLARSYDYGADGPWGQTSTDFHLLCQVVDYLRKKYYGVEPADRSPKEPSPEPEEEDE